MNDNWTHITISYKKELITTPTNSKFQRIDVSPEQLKEKEIIKKGKLKMD
jgi:hypothetical protein